MSVNIVNKTTGALQKVAGKIENGELVPSVSLYQSGQKTSDTTSWSSGETGTFSISLSEDMNDTDYVVVPTLSVTGVSASVHSKTSNSFKVTVRNDRTETITSAITLYWQAFKLMTDENRTLDETAIAQNTSDISDLQDDKQDKTLETPLTIGGTSRTTVEGALGGLNGVIPETASASNQLVTANNIKDNNYVGFDASAMKTSGKDILAIADAYAVKNNASMYNFRFFDTNAINAPNGVTDCDYLCTVYRIKDTLYNKIVAYNVRNNQIWTNSKVAGAWVGWIEVTGLAVSTAMVTLSPTDNTADNTTLRLRKVGKVVTASYFNSRTDSGTLKSNWSVIGTIPTGYRPTDAVYATVNHANSHNVTVGLQFHTDGTVRQYKYTEGNLGYERSVNLTWIVG